MGGNTLVHTKISSIFLCVLVVFEQFLAWKPSAVSGNTASTWICLWPCDRCKSNIHSPSRPVSVFTIPKSVTLYVCLLLPISMCTVGLQSCFTKNRCYSGMGEAKLNQMFQKLCIRKPKIRRLRIRNTQWSLFPYSKLMLI